MHIDNKKSNRMKQTLYLLFFVCIFAMKTNAQVIIGSTKNPEPGAILELKSTELGFLPTRVELSKLSLPNPLPAHVEGMVIYNLTVSTSDTLQAGFYYNTGKRWVRLSTAPSFSQSWFYMPSIAFDASAATPAGDPSLTVDLYGEFKKQLSDAKNTDVVSSAGAPNVALSTIPAATDLNYYVTAYDKEVFKIESISASGLMTYRILDTATDATFINIVFVEK